MAKKRLSFRRIRLLRRTRIKRKLTINPSLVNVSTTESVDSTSNSTNDETTATNASVAQSSTTSSTSAMEGMIGEIRMFGGNFAPRGWALCEGQLLSISENTSLFSILGTIYGGDGRTTFALPDLRGRVPIQAGHGPGLSDYRQGTEGGTEEITLVEPNLPNHDHNGTTASADQEVESGSLDAVKRIKSNSTQPHALITNNTGGNLPFSIMQPYLCLNFIICISGIFPSRS